MLVRKVAWAGAALALVASGCGDDGAAKSDLPVEQIAQRVERLRGMQFEHVPEVRVLDQDQFNEETAKVAQASASGVQKGDLAQAKRRLAAARQFIFLTGLLTPDEISQATSGGGDLAGLYSFKTNELLVLDKGSRRSRESTVAHELTHALEDQVLGSRLALQLSPLSERQAAYQALLEGSATLVQLRYAKRYLGARGSLDERLGELERKAADSELPEPLAIATIFPYAQGARFVLALERQAGGWKLIDRAHRHPPTTTSSVIHPARFLARDRPTPPRMGELGGDWTKLGALELGELDTISLLRSGLSDSRADSIAAGWAGAGVQAFRRGQPGACAPPCRGEVSLQVGWTWRSSGAATAFARAMPEWFRRALRARPAGTNTWKLDGGAAAVSVRGRETHLAFAPTAGLARALAEN